MRHDKSLTAKHTSISEVGSSLFATRAISCGSNRSAPAKGLYQPQSEPMTMCWALPRA